MRHKKLKVAVTILLCLGLTTLYSQVGIPVSGGNATGSGGSLSYSVGQIVYTAAEGSSGSVEQGIQQPYKISIITGLERTEGITLQYSAYPNPTTHSVTLKVEDFKTVELTYQLYDLTGKQIENKKVKSNETNIDLSDLTQAIYLLKLIDNYRELKIFKIFKSN